jgi:hypothetical protein
VTQPRAERARPGANRQGVTPSYPATPLRPLGLGELLDRAVTLCVKYFVPFSLIYVAYAIPLGIVTFFASARNTRMIEALTDGLRSRATGQAQAPDLSAFYASSSASDVWWTLALFALLIFVGPIATAALIDATSETYLGRVATFAHAYRVGVARWLPLIGINLLYAVAAFVLYAIAILATVLVFLALGLITAYAHVFGIVLDVVIGAVIFVALIVFMLVVLLAVQMSYFACVVEGAGVVTSFSRGIGRVSNGIGFKRAVLVGLAYLAITIAISLVSLAGQGIIVGLLRSPLAGAVFATLVSVATAAFLTAFMTIFYFDLRVREEGFDLQLAAQATFSPPFEGA